MNNKKPDSTKKSHPGDTVRKKKKEQIKLQSDILRNISDVVYTTDLQFRLTSWNNAAEIKYGWEEDEVLGKSVFEFVGSKFDPEKRKKLTGELLKNGSVAVQVEHTTRFGKPIVFDSITMVRRDASGKPNGFVGVNRDMSKRNRLEQKLSDAKDELEVNVQKRTKELEQSQENYRTLFNSIDEGFCVVEVIFDANNKPIDYRFLEINPAFEKQTGLHDVEGKLMRSLAPEHEEHWFRIYGRVALTGKSKRFINEAKALNRWYNVYAFRVGKPEARKVAILFNDITKPKRVEEELANAKDELETKIQERTAELKASEEKYRILVNSIPDEVWFADTNKNFTLANPAALHEFSYGKAGIDVETLAKISEVYRPDGTPRPVDEAPPLRALQGKNIRNQEEIVRTPANGELRYRQVSAAPVRDADGNIIGSVSVVRDITDQKRAQEALKESEDRFIKAFHRNPVAQNISRTSDGRFVDVNDSFLNLIGYTREEIIGHTSAELNLYPNVNQRAQVWQVFQEKGRLRNQELTLQTKVGRIINVLSSTEKFAHQGEEQAITTIVDITERKRVEKALAENTQNLITVAEAVTTGIGVIGMSDGKFLYVNSAYEKCFGYDHAELIGRTTPDIYWDIKDRNNILELLKKTGNKADYDIRLKKKDGTMFWGMASVRPITFNGNPALLGIFTDISDRKQAEEAVQTTLNRFYSVLSEMPMGILLVTEDGLVEFANQAFCDVFNIKESPTDLRNRTSREIIEKIQIAYMNPEKSVAHIMEILAHGEPVKGEDVPMRGGQTVLRDFVPIHLGENRFGRLWIHRDITERKKIENALKESEANANALIKYAPTGIYELDYRTQRFLNINDAMSALTGYTKEELFALGPGAMLDADSKKLFAARIRRQLAGEKIDDSVEYRVRKKDGFTLWITLNIAFSNNNPNTALVIGHDITERIEAETRLKESEEKYRELFVNMTEGFALCELILDGEGKPSDYRVLEANLAWEKITGLSFNQIAGKPLKQLIPELEQYWIDGYGKVALAGEPLHLENYNKSTERWYDIYAYSPRKGYFVSLVSNITERKKVEEELQTTQRLLQEIIDGAPNSIFVKDLQGRFIIINAQLEKLLGKSREEVKGKTDYEIISRDRADNYQDNDRRIAENDKPEQLEEEADLADGKHHYFLANKFPLHDIHGKTYAVASVSTDLTEIRHAENRLKESEEKFSKAFNSSNVGLVITNLLDGRWVDANNTYLKMLEYTREEVLGRTANEINLYPDPAQRIQILQTLKDEGEVREIEVRLRAKSGRIIETLSSVNRINLRGQECTLSTIVDITQRKQAEAEINRLNRELKAIGECDQAIVHANTEQALLNEVCSILHLTAGYRMAWIGSVEHDQNKSVRPNAWSGDEEYLKNAKITWADTDRGRGPTGSAGREGKTYFFQDFVTAPAAAPWRESALSLGYRSSIAVPMFDNVGTVLAVLTLYSTVPNYFNDSEIQLLESLAGDIAFGIVALRDRVKRQQAEAEITHLASFPELNPNPILELDAEGNVKYANPAAKIYLPSMVQGQKRTYLIDLIDMLLKERAASIIRDINLDNSWYELAMVFVPSTKNYMLYGRNITIRKEAEKALMESEDKFSKAFHSSPVGLVITHLPDGRWVDANDTYLKMLEYTREEVMGHTSSDLKIYPDTGKRAQIFRILKEEGKIRDIELSLRTKTGRIIETLSSVEKLYLQGQEHSLSTNVDITDRKNAEDELRQRTAELEASNKELEAFSYSVSHDLRAPLRSITGFSAVLLEDYGEKLDKEGQQYLRKIQDSGELMGQLMDDLLKLSRVTRSDLRMEKLDLSGMARETISDLEATEPKRKVKVTIAPNMTAEGDKNLLSLVLQNLLGNAWKFTSKTVEPRIEIGITEHKDKQAFFVRDNGSGFDMVYANKLFQPFQRLHKASEFAGTGIGLATVQRIIRRHGGEVWAEGKVGQGATFYFTLA